MDQEKAPLSGGPGAAGHWPTDPLADDSNGSPSSGPAVNGNRIRAVPCRICQSMIDITDRSYSHVVMCKYCREATPIKTARGTGKKYVACPCKCLIIAKATSTRIACPRANCRAILDLDPMNEQILNPELENPPSIILGMKVVANSKDVTGNSFREMLEQSTFLKVNRTNTDKKAVVELFEELYENEEDIYIVTCKSGDQVSHSAFVAERAKKHGLEVIPMTEPVGPFCVQQLKDYDGKKLELPEDEEKKKRFDETKAKFEPLCKVMMESLHEKVEKVTVSDRLVHSPCSIVTSQHDNCSDNMDRMMKAQALRDTSTMGSMAAKMHLEINPKHPIMDSLLAQAEAYKNDRLFKDMVTLLYELALVSSDFSIEDPGAGLLADRVLGIIKHGLGLEDGSGDAGAADVPTLKEADADAPRMMEKKQD